MPLESYVIGKLIGKGSYGQVSLAKHKRDKKQYVIKKIDLHEASDRERTFAQQEVQILAKLKHPNIVSYKESFQNNEGFLHIVMGYCEGGDLYTKLKDQGKRKEHLSEKQIVEWFVQIAMALQFMHDRNILHRDLKTQNIFLTKSKIIKVGDLGIARVLESTADMATTLIGTPYYMSPELFSNRPYNYKSDVWALGCCVYEMATLKHAFNARDMNALVYKILKGKTPPMPKQYSEELSIIIKSMLENNPSDRPSASRILRHPYIKKHIAIFLEGTKSRKQSRDRSKEKAQPKPASSGDSGFVDANAEGIATASGIDIDLVNDERQGKYIVDDESGKSEEPVAKGSPAHAGKPIAESLPSKESGKRNEGKSHRKQSPPRHKDVSQGAHVEDASKADVHHEKNQLKKLERVSSVGDKDESPRRKASQKDRKKSGSHSNSPFDKPIAVKNPRPLPPRPVESHGSPNIDKQERDLEGPGEREYDTPAQVALPKKSVGVPNVSARKKRRQRLAGEAYPHPPARKSSGQSQSVSSSSHDLHGRAKGRQKKVLGPDVVDSVDGIRQSSSTASDEDSETEGDVKQERKRSTQEGSNSPLNGDHGGTDITDLIGTMQEALDMDLRPRSGRSPSLPNDESSETTPQLDQAHSPLSQTVSGRLNDRIQRLRKECIRGIGEDMLQRAFRILEQDEDNLEDAFIELMGVDNYEMYGDAVQQLKFCEEFAERSL